MLYLPHCANKKEKCKGELLAEPCYNEPPNAANSGWYNVHIRNEKGGHSQDDAASTSPFQSRLFLLTALDFAKGSDSSGVSPVSVLGFQSDRAAEGTLGSPSGHGGDASVPPGRLGYLV